ncbi:MAG: hypothetical protein KDH96_04390 [Candidatus Riesia sp.]|nr:hypothetical protein [Candidatus Riesia sp.]
MKPRKLPNPSPIMAKVVIYHSKGNAYYKILRGIVYCTRMNAYLRRSGQWTNNKKIMDQYPPGTYIMDIGLLGYDYCDVIR